MSLFGPIDINRAIQMIVIIVIAIDIHELAHAVVADRLGDSTPRRMGEISLNPFTHMDQFGIILLLITSISNYAFTYGRTHVTPTNLKFGPQRGNAIVAIAGPLSNLALAAILGVVVNAGLNGQIHMSPNTLDFLFLAAELNALLFLLNLLPIPPLDGFTVLGGFLSARQMYSLAPLQQWGPMILLLIIVFAPSVIFGDILQPAMNQILNVVCPSCYA